MGQLANYAFDGSGTGTFPGAKSRDVIFSYNFATQGGAVGNIKIGTLSAGAIVTNSLVIVTTVPTSSGAATAGISSEAAGDIVAAGLISAAPWSTAGRKAGVPVSSATSIATTVDRDVNLVIGTAALTAGVFTLRLTII